MGFRTNILPCIEVLRADGRVCQGFQAKPEGTRAHLKATGKADKNALEPTGSRRGRPKGSLDILID
jgi:hypothetical protein